MKNDLVNGALPENVIKKRNKLNTYTINKLEAIYGWHWTKYSIAGENKSFNRNYNKLVKWVKEHGRLPNP